MDTEKHFGKGSKFPAIPEEDKLLRLISMRFCPYAHRVHLALYSKNIPHHTIYCNLMEKPEFLFEKSPLGKVPALELPNEEGCPTILGSLAICEYLDEKYPQNPLLPRDPLKKYYDKTLMEKFGAVMSAWSKVYLIGPSKSPGCVEEATEALTEFDRELATRKTIFFGGDKPAWVDYMIWPWCERLAMVKHLDGEKYDVDYGKLKTLAKWIDAMKEDRAVKLFFLDGKTHAMHVKSKHTGKPEYDILVKA